MEPHTTNYVSAFEPPTLDAPLRVAVPCQSRAKQKSCQLTVTKRYHNHAPSTRPTYTVAARDLGFGCRLVAFVRG